MEIQTALRPAGQAKDSDVTDAIFRVHVEADLVDVVAMTPRDFVACQIESGHVGTSFIWKRYEPWLAHHTPIRSSNFCPPLAIF
mmetsp:Transcript_20369/g.33905  ORF Transcript_20369/g.33905 Transcript_20369/m.33905 type:complete len:84 (+) Transcript_20369:571-822(+)